MKESIHLLINKHRNMEMSAMTLWSEQWCAPQWLVILNSGLRPKLNRLVSVFGLSERLIQKGSVSLCMMSEYHDGICWRGPTTAPVLSQMVQHGLLWHAWLERLTVQTGGYALHQPIASPAGNGEPAYTCYPCLHIFNHTSLSLPTIQLERGRVQHTWA